MAEGVHEISPLRKERRVIRLLLFLMGGKTRKFWLLLATDVLGMSLSYLFSYGLLISLMSSIRGKYEPHLMTFFLVALFLVVNLYFQGSYQAVEERRPESEIKMVIKGTSFGFLLLFMVNFMVLKEPQVSPYLLLSWWLTVIPSLIALRLALRELDNVLWRRGHLQQRVLLVGTGSGAEWVGKHLSIQGYDGFKCIGMLLDTDDRLTASRLPTIPVLGSSVDLAFVSKTFEIDRVFIVMSAFSNEKLIQLFHECQSLGLSMNVISDMFKVMHDQLEVNEHSGLLTIKLDNNSLNRHIDRILKRCMDIMLSLCAIPVLGVLYLCIGLMIKKEDGGAVIYRRKVLGTDGIEFDAFKFRSMCPDAEVALLQNEELKREFEKNYKLTDDPRITRVGSFIRKYNLDEVPQFLNVLKGQMSLVGPRMITRPELEKFGQWKHKLLTVKPGMTGFWQVRGRQTVSYDDRVKMDMFYIDYASIWMDIYLIIATVWKLCKVLGAY